MRPEPGNVRMKRGQSAPFSHPITRKPVIPPPESLSWWWNPGRAGVRSGPRHFTTNLEAIDPNLAVTWDAYSEKWNIWMRNQRIQNKICSGWLLLFIVEPRELDERVFHRLYSASSRKWGSAKQYFDSVEREMQVSKERADKASYDELMAQARANYDYMQVKNIGSGHKFSKYLS